MIRVRLTTGAEATLRGRTWQSDDPTAEEMLRAVQRVYPGRSPSQPHPELAEAEWTLDYLGGEVVEVSDPPPTVEGRVY